MSLSFLERRVLHFRVSQNDKEDASGLEKEYSWYYDISLSEDKFLDLNNSWTSYFNAHNFIYQNEYKFLFLDT